MNNNTATLNINNGFPHTAAGTYQTTSITYPNTHTTVPISTDNIRDGYYGIDSRWNDAGTILGGPYTDYDYSKFKDMYDRHIYPNQKVSHVLADMINDLKED